MRNVVFCLILTISSLCLGQGKPGGGGGSGGGGGTGTVNSASQYSATYYSGAGSSTTVSGLPAPTTPNSVPQYLISTPSGSAATTPTYALAGVPTNPQTGITYTYVATDRASYTSFSNVSAIAVILPQAGTSGFGSNFVNVSCDIGTGTATITPTTSTISYSNGSTYTSGASTMALTTGQCAWIYSDNSNYFAILRGGGAGGGVSSFTGDGTLINNSGSTGAVTATLANAGAHKYFGNNTGSSAAPGYVSIATGDLPPIPLTGLATQSANTVVANVTGSTATPTAASIPSGIQNYVAGSGYNQATSHQVVAPLQCADSSGSGTAQVCNTTPSFTPAAGDAVIYTTTTANTGTGLTLNVNSLGAKSVAKWQGATTLAANDVLANKEVLLTYDGTNWEISTIGNAPTGGGSTPTGTGFVHITSGTQDATAQNPTLDKSGTGLANPTADATFTYPASSTTGLTMAGTAPASSASTGTAATTLLNINGVTGGATTGSATTAGAGSSPTIAGGVGGSGAGGTNAIGGAGGNISLSPGNGGASGGTAVNSNGGSVIVTPGVAGTGGSGTAGKAGVLQVSGSNAGFIGLQQGSDNTTANTNIPANTIVDEAPTSVTAYRMQRPGTNPTNNNSAMLCSNATPSVCAWGKMSQVAFLTTTYTNATTSFTSVAGLSFSVEASTNYKIQCDLDYQTSATTADVKIQWTGPASPTAVTYDLTTEVTGSTLSASVATAFSTALSEAGTPTITTNFPLKTSMTLINGTTAGTVQLQAAATGTGTISIIPGSCEMQ